MAIVDKNRLIENGTIRILYSADGLTLYAPQTKKALDVLRTRTQWPSIEATEESNRDSTKRSFEGYSQQGQILILHPQNARPFFIHFPTSEFRNYAGEQVALPKLLTAYPILSQIGSRYLSEEQCAVADFMLNPTPSIETIIEAAKTIPQAVRKGLLLDQIEMHENDDYIDTDEEAAPLYNQPRFQDFLRTIHSDNFSGAAQVLRTNYTEIRKYPLASREFQMLALETAKTLLDRVRKTTPDYIESCVATAHKTFKTLTCPIPEVSSWLDENNPARPALNVAFSQHSEPHN